MPSSNLMLISHPISKCIWRKSRRKRQSVNARQVIITGWCDFVSSFDYQNNRFGRMLPFVPGGADSWFGRFISPPALRYGCPQFSPKNFEPPYSASTRLPFRLGRKKSKKNITMATVSQMWKCWRNRLILQISRVVSLNGNSYLSRSGTCPFGQRRQSRGKKS